MQAHSTFFTAVWILLNSLLLTSCSTLSLFSPPIIHPNPSPVALVPAPSPLLDQANQYARDGLYREAVAALRKYLSERPKDSAAQRTLGIVYVKTGAYKLAIQYLSEALPSYPDNFEINYYIAEAFRTQNRYAEAIFHYQKALQQEPKNTSVLKALAWSYHSIRYYAEALKIAKTLKKLDPNDFQISIINARILNKVGMNEKALQMLSKTEALSSPEELPYLYSVKGDILLDQGQGVEAEQAYRRALQDQPLLPGALMGLAKKMVMEKQNLDLAITYLERAMRIRPGLVEANYLLGQAYELKDPRKSLEYFRRFASEASMDPQFQQEILYVKNKISAQEAKLKNPEPTTQLGKIDELEEAL